MSEPGGRRQWPEIVYRQVGHKLVACVAQVDRYVDIYPAHGRLYELPRLFGRDAMAWVNSLTRASRRKLERLVAYCPSGCAVVAAYIVDSWLLWKLVGDFLLTDGPGGRALTRAGKSGKAAFLRHQPQFWLQPPEGRRQVACPHGRYTIDAFDAFTIACSAVAAQERRTVAVAQLAPQCTARSRHHE